MKPRADRDTPTPLRERRQASWGCVAAGAWSPWRHHVLSGTPRQLCAYLQHWILGHWRSEKSAVRTRLKALVWGRTRTQGGRQGGDTL